MTRNDAMAMADVMTTAEARRGEVWCVVWGELRSGLEPAGYVVTTLGGLLDKGWRGDVRFVYLAR